jgi:hypothetical protein
MDTHTTNSVSAESLNTYPSALPLARPRLTYLDSLRTMMITAVVVAHLTITYGSTLGNGLTWKAVKLSHW